MSETRRPSADSVALSTGLSLAFWTVFLLASALFAVLSLGPRFATQLELRERFNRGTADSAELQAEIDHLTKLATALQCDPDFVHRLADEEFRPASPDKTRIPVDLSLNFDARVPVASDRTEVVMRPSGWLITLLTSPSENSRLRLRLQLLLLLLVLVGFVCLHEEVFSTRYGGRIRQFGEWLISRYLVRDDRPA